MNKKSILSRAIATGAIVAQLGSVIAPATNLVAGAITPSSAGYTQAAFNADVETYKAKLAEYEAAKKAYDTAKAQYDKDMEAYKTAEAAYQRVQTKYQADLATYEAKLKEFEAASGQDGTLAVPAAQALIFNREPNARVSFSGTTRFFTWGPEDDGLGVINASAGAHEGAGHVTANPIWVNVPNPGNVGGGTGETGRIDATAMGLKKGETLNIRYDNLENSSYRGRKITSVNYAYTVESSPSADESFTMVFYKDPTVTTYFGTSKDGDANRLGLVRLTPTYYYEDGSKVEFRDDAIFSFASLNYSNSGIGEKEHVRGLQGLEPIQINGSSVTYSNGVLGANSSNHAKDDGSRFDRQEWDSTELNPNSYYGAGAARTTGGDVSFLIGNEPLAETRGTLRYWFQFNSNVRAVTLPARPEPPKPPVAPTAPTEPIPPTIPVGPLSVQKSVSADGKTFSPALTPGDALDVGTQKDSWTWKLDFTLSNNTQYSSVVLADDLVDGQTTSLEDIVVLDATGKDVTSSGDVQVGKTVGQPARVTWTAKSGYLDTINKDAKGVNQPRFTMKIKTTAATARGEVLRRYLDPASNMIVLPNQGSLVVTGSTGGNAEQTVTEKSNLSHVKFKAENTVENPEKKVSDLNEREVTNNHLGLVDRNQKYTISFDTGSGTIFSKLKIADALPNGFTAKRDSIRITNSAGKDITDQFEIGLNGQNLTAQLKEAHQASTDLVSTKVSLVVEGTAVRWLGDLIKNTATVEDSEKTLKTNETVTVIPEDGQAVKEVTVDDGESFSKSETDEAASKVLSVHDEYTWRNTFTLPSQTNFTKVEIKDTFESIQSLDQEKVRVINHAGEDVTSQGKLTVTKLNDLQSEVVWVGNADYLKKLNNDFGKSRDARATVTMSITTSVTDATAAQLNGYMNGAKDVIIPNVSNIMLRDDSGITTDYKMDSNVSKVSVPSKVDNGEEGKPEKTVTDNNETRVSENHLGFGQTQQTYEVTAQTAGGHVLEKLIFRDKMPKSFTTDVSKVAISTQEGHVVTDLFDISISADNLLVATLKDAAKSDKRVIATRVTLSVTGSLPAGHGDTVTNKAEVEDNVSNYETGTVTTYVPNTPESVKSVSVDGGTSFSEVGDLAKRSDEYIWKVDHKLSNFTEYESITLTDKLEGVQEVDRTKIKVFSYDGQDVTAKGDLKVEDADGKKLVSWVANKELISDINTKFGAKSKDIPRLSMTITTNVRNAKNADEALLFNQETGKVEIPNVAGLKIQSKNEGGIEVTSNAPKVTLPTPGESSAKKFVALDGDNPQWSDKLQLSNFDEVYQYRTEFKLADNFNFDEGGLVLTDTYENLQSYDKVLVTDASGADITGKFDVNVGSDPATPRQVVIKAVPKRANDFDDKGETINLVIKGVKLTGASGEQQLAYISTKDSEGGFHSGITIPNISGVKHITNIPGQNQDKQSNKTFVNFDVAAHLVKSAEDELTQVVNPKDATDETPLSELVAAAQKLLSEPGKASSQSLKKLQEGLATPDLSSRGLLTLLIEATK